MFNGIPGIIIKLLGYLYTITYFYLRVLLPIVLSIGIVLTLIGMACNFGGSMGIAVPVFLVGIFIASYIIYGPKTFEYIMGAVKGTGSFFVGKPMDTVKAGFTSNPKKESN
jgi:hypothetical protein